MVDAEDQKTVATQAIGGIGRVEDLELYHCENGKCREPLLIAVGRPYQGKEQLQQIPKLPEVEALKAAPLVGYRVLTYGAASREDGCWCSDAFSTAAARGSCSREKTTTNHPLRRAGGRDESPVSLWGRGK